MANNQYSRLALRRGTKASLKAINPLLREGEPMVEIDTGRMKVGDGNRRYNKLKYVGGGNDGTTGIASFTIVPSTVAHGTEVNSVKFSYVFTGEPDKITISSPSKIYFSEEFPENTSGSITVNEKIDGEFGSNTDFTLQLDLDEGNPITKTASLKYASYLYYGQHINLLTGISETMTAVNLGKLFKSQVLNKKFSSSRTATIDTDCGKSTDAENTYVYIFLPVSVYGTSGEIPIHKIGVDGADPMGTGGMCLFLEDGTYSESADLSEGFTINIINEANYSEAFYILRTNHPNIGTLKITIS